MTKLLAVLALLITTTTFAEKLTQKDINMLIDKGMKEIPSLLYVDVDKEYIDYLKQRPFKIGAVMPDAITIGALFRCQNGIGVCGGEQVNITKEKGKWKVSTYTLMGMQAGFAEMYKLEFYVAACYGSCIGINAEGFFFGVDGMFGYGVGGGFFVDVGVDVTDVVMNKTPSLTDLKEVLNFKTAYVGWGYDIGVGVGISAGLYYYLHNETTEPLYVNEFMRTPLFKHK